SVMSARFPALPTAAANAARPTSATPSAVLQNAIKSLSERPRLASSVATKALSAPSSMVRAASTRGLEPKRIAPPIAAATLRSDATAVTRSATTPTTFEKLVAPGEVDLFYSKDTAWDAEVDAMLVGTLDSAAEFDSLMLDVEL